MKNGKRREEGGRREICTTEKGRERERRSEDEGTKPQERRDEKKIHFYLTREACK